ncbi:MAG: hypothetical protein AB1483_04150 [Candidatus Zixiibacteriota bacterium]
MGSSGKVYGLCLAVLSVLMVWSTLVAGDEHTIRLYDGEAISNHNRRCMTANISKDASGCRLSLDLWQGECRLEIACGAGPSGYRVEGDTIEALSDDIGHRFYRNESGLEWEIVLKRRPASNVLEYAMSVKNLRFYYQDSLSVFERDVLGAIRPDSVVGAWVAYHALRSDNILSVSGGDTLVNEYRTGQAFIVYRPKAWSGNDTVWCDLNIDVKRGRFEIVLDKMWLESADYPVTIDPTFGNTSVGGSTMSWNLLYAYCHRLAGVNTYQVPSGKTATITQYSVYGCETGSGDMSVSMAAFEIVSGTPQSRVGDRVNVTISGGTPAWFSSAILEQELSEGNEYGVAVSCAPRSGGTIYYNGVTNAVSTDNTYCGLDWDGWTHSSLTSFNFSMYATYTEQVVADETVSGRRKQMIGHKEGGCKGY